MRMRAYGFLGGYGDLRGDPENRRGELSKSSSRSGMRTHRRDRRRAREGARKEIEQEMEEMTSFDEDDWEFWSVGDWEEFPEDQKVTFDEDYAEDDDGDYDYDGDYGYGY